MQDGNATGDAIADQPPDAGYTGNAQARSRTRPDDRQTSRRLARETSGTARFSTSHLL